MRLPDAAKREERGCDRESDRIVYSWAPELKRCPRSLLTDDVLELLQWWEDWKRFQCYPYGSQTINEEPAFVYDALKLIEDTHQKAMSESTNA